MFQFIYFLFLFAVGFNVCLCFEDAWYTFHKSLKDANREELVVTNITTDENFKLDYKVKKWTSLSVGPVCYSVGLMDTGIVVLFSTLSGDGTKFNIKSHIKDFGRKPLDALLLSITKEGQSKIFIIMAFSEQSELIWFKIDEENVVHFWNMPLLQPVLHINQYQVNEKNILLVANNSTTVTLYEYDLMRPTPDYWVLHNLYLSSPAESSAFNNFEYDYYLSIPQRPSNVLLIYKFEDYRFVPYKNLTSKNLNSIASFEISFKSFLAVDGLNAGIYQFTRNGLVREDIINSNLDGITYWLPVPVITHRDEVILFAQRTLDHATHKTRVIEIVTYNGGKFEEHEDIPCSHFGEQPKWLACLANGIIGSSYIAVDDKLGLIVPGISNNSFVFIVHFTVKQMPDPKLREIQELTQMKERIQLSIQSQIKEYKKIKNLYKPPAKDIPDNVPKKKILGKNLFEKQRQSEKLLLLNEKLEKIGLAVHEIKEKVKRIVEKEKRKEFNTITINGRLKIEGHARFGDVKVDKIKGISATDLLQDIVRKDSLKRISGIKTLMDLEVEKISFERVNDVEASEIVTKEDGVISLNGNITFKNAGDIQNIRVLTRKINNISMEEVVDVRKKIQGVLEFENVNITDSFQIEKVNDLNVPSKEINTTDFKSDVDLSNELEIVFLQNVSVVNVNGENFEDFISKLCLININCYVPGHVRINGNITTKHELFAEYLNKLKFPDEYLLMDSINHSNITGKKIFQESLTGKEIGCRGTVDGLDTKQLITLSTNQNISGKIIFKDIQVVEALNVSGKILGEHVDKFLPNPTLELVKYITSNMNFKKLEVDGNVIVEKNLNGIDLEKILKDLVYKDDENVTITSRKEFPQGYIVKENFQIESNSINNINISSLITKDTDQTLDINFLNGDVTFENLELSGTYGGINVTQLDQDLVKLTGDHHISSTLIFDKDIEVKNFEITKKLNDLTADEYFYVDGDREIATDLIFEDIVAEDLIAEGNISGNLSDIDLSNFNERYLSYSKDQIIEVPYNIKHAMVDNLQVENINDNDYDDLFNSEHISEKVKTLLENDQLKIENLVVNGSIDVQKVNDRKMDDILPKGVLTEDDGTQRKNISIQGNMYVNDIQIDKLSNVNWTDYVKKLVYKDEVDLVLESPEIRFNQAIKVDKLIETKKLNGIPIENILTKEGSQEIIGDITIKGDVILKEGIEVAENINNVAVKQILDNFNVSNRVYIKRGDMIFRRLQHIYNLTVKGYVNAKNITDVLDHIVYINEDVTLYGETSFENTVNVSGNFAVQNINDINLSEVVPRIVLTTKDAEIQGAITFSGPVFIRKHLTVEGDLATNMLYGIDLEEWKENAIFVDKGLLEGNYTFENVVIKDDLTTKFVNDIDMDSVIPLRSDQSIDYLELEEVDIANKIDVGNLVNGYNLPEEYGKTVMANLDQEIHSNVVFQNNVLVRQNLSTQMINDKEVSKIVTTDTDQNLTAAFNFNSRCRMESDVHIYGLINGVNTSLWLNDGVRIHSPKVQEVYDDWAISKNITFNDDVKGLCVVNGMNLINVMDEVEEKKNYKYKVERDIIKDYENLCIDVTNLYQSAKKQIYKFKYFEEFQTLLFPDQVQHVHYFEHEENHYLLVNQHNCSSQLLMFNSTAFYPVSLVETGHISQVISVLKDDILFLVMTDAGKLKQEECETEGTNVWKLDQENIILEYNMDHQDVLQESKVPGTFYGLNKGEVVEYKINQNNGPRKYRKWVVSEENADFVPRGLNIGLALRTGHKIISLDRSDPLVEEDLGDTTESVIIGNFSEARNYFLPGRHEGDLIVTTVGIKSARRNLLAVATHEETSVRGRLDFIKIYGDALKGELFHKVPSYKPSSLVSIDFNQGETLLAFIENERTLQIYEYKGIEGFKHRSSARIHGSHLFLMTLPIQPYLNSRKAIGIVHENTIRIIQAVMLGNQIRDDLKCEL